MDINILSAEQYAELTRLIDSSNNIVICCHKSPDGDAIGSSLAMAEYLSTIFKPSSIIIPDAYPDFLRWLPGSERIIRYDKHKDRADELIAKADLIFCLDFNNTSRVDAMQQSLDAATANKVMIDHHLEPNIDAALIISRPDMSSTSEMVFRIINQFGGFESMSRKCATVIYCGIMTDTGCFTYNSNSPEVFYIISLLLTKRINKDKIYRNVYNNYSAWALRLRGYVMCHKLNVIDDLHVSYFSITRQNMKDAHFAKGDGEGLVNEPLRIKGMKLSISLREDDRKDNLVWVSLRSVDDFPCNKMAEMFFNGGGHLNASGGRLYCSIEEAVSKTKEAIAYFADMLR